MFPSVPPMWRDRLDAFCERGIHVLMVGLLVFGPLALGGTHAEFFAVMAGLGAAALLLWLVRIWVRADYALLWPPLAWAVAAFLIYAVMRGHEAVVEYTARGELLHLALYGTVFFVTLNNLNRQHSANWIAGALIAVATFAAMYAVSQFLTKSGHVWQFVRPESYAGRGSGTYICPNHLAGLLEIALPLALAYLLSGRLAHLARVLTGYAVLVMIAGLVSTESRGGWAASALALLVLLAVLLGQRGQRLPALIVLVLLMVAAVWIVSEVKTTSERVHKALNPDKLDDPRFKIWPAAVKIWQANFWWGAGPGHFDHLFRQHRDGFIQARPGRAHNDYLDTLADYGVAGAALVAAAFALVFIGVFRVWRHVQREGDDFRTRQSNRAAFVLGGSVALISLLLHSVVDFNFHIPANATAAVVIMALLAAHFRFATDDHWVRPGVASRVALMALGLVAAVWLWHGAFLRAHERTLITKSDAAPIASAQLDFLRQAHALEPANSETCFAIGEVLRVTAWERPDNHRELAEEAMEWFDRAATLNPYDSYPRLRYGMCLDLLGDRQLATRHFLRALELDPNGGFTLTHVGWHYAQLDDWSKVKAFTERSLKVQPNDNRMAELFLQTAVERLAEGKVSR
ncbi:MAG: O-antigen ligase family protein [Verrucomicrobia bacterium]|nr:O-antigen ligase family protein [Verrucomicrobiota bacterium]